MYINMLSCGVPINMFECIVGILGFGFLLVPLNLCFSCAEDYVIEFKRQIYTPTNGTSLRCTLTFLKPRYKRLVDQIYNKRRGSSEVTLSSMDKLTYFSLNYPEKVNKLAAYFHKKITNQIQMKKYQHVDVSLQAFDILLASSPTQSYNLYAEHFLVIVSQLLATNEQQFRNTATRSMEKFSLLKEETPLYHGCYETLICQYSTMCKDEDVITRLLGAKGLNAIVCKIVLQELAENIWKPVHMNKIVSGLLYCMYQPRKSPYQDEIQVDHCGQEAEKCMSALMTTASFNQVISILNSVYSYLDESNLWNDRVFTSYVYRLVMNSIQSRYWHAIVINAISHLQQQANAPVTTRRNELKVLCTMLELIKSRVLGPLLLDYLVFLFAETSRINSAKNYDPQELLYAQDLMDCLESVSGHLAEFESLEVMVFITEKILEDKEDKGLKDTMFRCLYTVALSYKNRFPLPMFRPLLYLMTAPSTTEMGQTIFHTLLDVHGNLATVDLPSYDIKLKNKPYSRGNMFFVRTYDIEIYTALLNAFSSTNEVKPNFVKTFYKTLVTMAAYQDPETILTFIACLLFVQQEFALAGRLDAPTRAELLILTVGLLISASDITGDSGLANYGREGDIGSDTQTSLFDESSSPVLRGHISEDLSVDAMKKVLAAPFEETRKTKAAKFLEARNKYAKFTLEEITHGYHDIEDEEFRQAAKKIINAESKPEASDDNQTLTQEVYDRFADIFY